MPTPGVSSAARGIERLCREHVTFIALCGDTAPHFTTLAAFVSSLGEETARLFVQVLYLCDRQGLIGREMFAIDGVKLPSNASKTKSGTRADSQAVCRRLELPGAMLCLAALSTVRSGRYLCSMN